MSSDLKLKTSLDHLPPERQERLWAMGSSCYAVVGEPGLRLARRSCTPGARTSGLHPLHEKT